MSSKNYDSLLTTADPEVPGQKFFCVSFLEPKDHSLVKLHEKFLAKKFLQFFVGEHKKSAELVMSNPEKKPTDFMKQFLEPTQKGVSELYDSFVETNGLELEKEFCDTHNPHNHNFERGLKVRGSYATIEEASERAKEMYELDGKVFDTYVCSVGHWAPFAPKAGCDMDYYDDKLNDIIKFAKTEKYKKTIEHEMRLREEAEAERRLREEMMAELEEEKKE